MPTTTVTLAGRPVDLTPTEFQVLEILGSHPNKVFTPMQLVDQARGHAFEGYERTVDANMKNLRSEIEHDPREPRLILTVYGVGYKVQRMERDRRQQAAEEST